MKTNPVIVQLVKVLSEHADAYRKRIPAGKKLVEEQDAYFEAQRAHKMTDAEVEAFYAKAQAVARGGRADPDNAPSIENTDHPDYLYRYTALLEEAAQRLSQVESAGQIIGIYKQLAINNIFSHPDGRAEQGRCDAGVMLRNLMLEAMQKLSINPEPSPQAASAPLGWKR